MKKLKNLKLVIASGSQKARNCLQEMFEKRDANVVLCNCLDMNFVRQLEQDITADIILIDMDDSYEEDEEALDSLLDKIDLPILFHENSVNEAFDRQEKDIFSVQEIEKLAIKLADLVNEKLPDEKNEATESSTHKIAADVTNTILIEENIIPQLEDIETVLSEKQLIATDKSNELVNVWVLGASIGGPDAVKRFLARIPEELPVAFVLAQHLGDGFVPLLANQLNGVAHFKVKEGVDGDTLAHGEVVIVPVDCRMTLDLKGHIKLVEENWEGHYKPSIDCVINNVTSNFKKRSGVIIFSGMGSDGVLACQEFSAQYKGLVWAQNSDSSVISSMPDSVREANLVSYSGSPEALALKIAVQYMGKDSYIV